MKINFLHKNKIYSADLSQPIPISLPLQEGEQNPNCYYAQAPTFETISFGNDFVGDVSLGGTVNYQRISITPHGNGTHTECVGHLTAQKITLDECIQKFWFVAQVITVQPSRVENGDEVVLKSHISEKIHRDIEALIIRTLPNTEEKRTKKYSGTNPTYLEPSIGKYLAQMNMEHLLVDLPSVDRESDEGRLSVHKGFWNLSSLDKIDANVRKTATITELIFVPNHLQDGLYLLNIQVPHLLLDAVPSMPILYQMEQNA